MQRLQWAAPVVVGLTVGACAGTLAAPREVVANRAIQADFDTTWDAVVEWFALTNNPIATIERASGIIATEQLSDPTGSVDCGEAGYGYRYDLPEIRLNVFVREVTPSSTDVRVTVTGRVLRVGNIGATMGQAGWRTCYSRGSVERDLIDAVALAVS